MTYPADMTAFLSGATMPQLRRWREREILVPEVNAGNPPLYSWRDVVALRTIAYLRSKTSMQQIGKAFNALREMRFTGHPSEYKFGMHGKAIFFQTPEGNTIDLTRKPGQMMLFSLEEVFEPFTNLNDRRVVDFRRPRPHIEIDRDRLGGWPTIESTRIAYDTITRLVDGETIRVEDVEYYYPTVSTEAALDALALDELIREVA